MEGQNVISGGGGGVTLIIVYETVVTLTYEGKDEEDELLIVCGFVIMLGFFRVKSGCVLGGFYVSETSE